MTECMVRLRWLWFLLVGLTWLTTGQAGATTGSDPETASLIAAKNAPVIIGENMGRVNSCAGKVGATARAGASDAVESASEAANRGRSSVTVAARHIGLRMRWRVSR